VTIDIDEPLTMVALARVARDLGAALGHGPWVFEEHEHAARPIFTLRRADGAGLHFDSLGRDKGGKMRLSGHWPVDPRTGASTLTPSQHVDAEKAYSSINVDITRETHALARDIERRFMPGYLAAFESVLKRARQDAEDIERAEREIALLETAAGERTAHKHNRRPGLATISIPGGTIERRHGSDIKIEVTSVPLDAALAIIKILRTYDAGQVESVVITNHKEST
jgi:hypothetical protein